MRQFILRVRNLLTKKTFPDNPNYSLKLGKSSSLDGPPQQINGSEYIKIGDNSSLGKNIWLGAFDSYNDQKFTPAITIGNNVRIGNSACITGINEITIGDGCLFSEYVYISDHAHGTDPCSELSPKDQNLHSKGPVNIGENCFVGYRATILPGVSLGKNCVVGAHSVVCKSFPDNSMVAGVPAKLIKKYSFEKKEWIKAKE